MDLTANEQQSTLKLTTVGRKTGKKHSVVIWFVVAGPQAIYVQHVTAPAHWCKNMAKTAAVELDFGSGAVTGTATVITDAARKSEILALFRSKYFIARFLQFFGRRRYEPFVAQIDCAETA